MSQNSDDLITVLDAGSAKTRVLVAEIHEGALRYRAHGIADSDGMRKGLISDLRLAAGPSMKLPWRLREWPTRSSPIAWSAWAVRMCAE